MLSNKTILIMLAILVLFYVRIQKEKFDTLRDVQFCSQFSDYSQCYNNGCTIFLNLDGRPFCYPR